MKQRLSYIGSIEELLSTVTSLQHQKACALKRHSSKTVELVTQFLSKNEGVTRGEGRGGGGERNGYNIIEDDDSRKYETNRTRF